MMNELLAELLHELDSQQAPYAILQRYAQGNQPLAFLTDDQRKALDNRLARMSIGIPALVVRSIAERLRPSGFSDPQAWRLFVDSQLDQTAADAFAAALTFGQGFILCWSKDGRPTATVESPFECAVIRDPADHSVVAGVKRYADKTHSHAWVYLSDRVLHYTAPSTGPALNGYTLVDTIEHDLQMVPLVPLDNGVSEIEPILSLTDSLVKVTLDMVIASHAAGFGRRWATGLDLIEKPRLDAEGSPVLDGDGQPIVDVVSPINDMTSLPMIVSEAEATKFGNFSEPSLAGFETATKILVGMISATSSVPAHYLSPFAAAQVPSADGLRAAEASLVARVESKQLRYGRSLEDVARLLVAIETGSADIDMRVQWSPADSRSAAAEADSVVKLYQAGLLPASHALAKLGYSDDEIARIRAAKRAETLDAQGIGLDLAGDTE